MPKIKFLCLMRNARLAALSARYDDETAILSIERDGELLATGDLKNAGRPGRHREFLRDLHGLGKTRGFSHLAGARP